MRTLFLLFLIATAGLKAEEAKIKWIPITPVEEQTMYRVQMNYLKLKDPKDALKLREYTQKVVEILKKSDGAIQFALHAKPEKGEYWTLSVWKDEKSMKSFGASKEHREAVTEMMDRLEDLDFDHWNVVGAKIMTEWSEIIKN
jgi:quinol monooxygenase YgiN